MEMQACIKQYPKTSTDNQSLHYRQGFANRDAGNAPAKPRGMRVLFSGHGKAERNMGVAPLPPVIAFHTKPEFKAL